MTGHKTVQSSCLVSFRLECNVLSRLPCFEISTIEMALVDEVKEKLTQKKKPLFNLFSLSFVFLDFSLFSFFFRMSVSVSRSLTHSQTFFSLTLSILFSLLRLIVTYKKKKKKNYSFALRLKDLLSSQILNTIYITQQNNQAYYGWHWPVAETMP